MIRAPLRLLATLALAVGAPSTALAAGDAEAGKTKANTCMGCHGIPGYNNVYPTYRVPKLGGQSPAFLAEALKAYRSGERTHPTMRAQAFDLSDEDIEDIAAYLSETPAK